MRQQDQARGTKPYRPTTRPWVAARTHSRVRVWVFIAGLSVLGLSSCGEQDLYRPPTSPFEIAGRVAMPGEAMDVAVIGNYAYVAMEQGGLQSVDISDPAHPRLGMRSWSEQRMKSVVDGQAYDGDGTPRRLAFVAIGTEGLSTFDITSPDSLTERPTIWNGYYTESAHFVPASVITEEFKLFIADGRRGIAVAYQNLDSPGDLEFRLGEEHRSYTVGHAMSVAYADGYAYVADDQMGVSVVDASLLDAGGSLQLIGNIDTPGNAVDIATDGNYVFVADGEHGLQVMRIGPDRLLEPATWLSLGGDCRSLALHQGTLFVAAEDAGLYVIDVHDPAHPALAGTVPTCYAVGVDVNEHDIVCVADRDEGLLVFRNPSRGADRTPPAAVVDLAARLTDLTSLELTWTAPGDDGAQGTAAVYELRRSSEPLADSTWEAAVALARRPVPRRAGKSERLPIDDLTPGAVYYFGVRAYDEVGNCGALSNSAIARMTTPTLSSGMVSPDIGDVTTVFTYTVVYSDPEGEAPAEASVLIDNNAHTMAVRDSAPDYLAGATFTYAATLGWGSHQYRFAFDDGHGPLVTTAAVAGPAMPPDPFEFEMQRIDLSGGVTFTMGSPAGELGREGDETPHDVTLTRSFDLAATEATQTLYEVIVGENPSWFEGFTRPVTDVSWYDAVLFCNALSMHYDYTPAYVITDEVYNQEGDLIAAHVAWSQTANGFRLPTEAEWEYACRAGSQDALSNGALTVAGCLDPSLQPDSLLTRMGWYCGNSDLGVGPRTQDVALKEANPYGLYDMHGNAWEWCWDHYAAYVPLPVTDPIGPEGDVGDPRVRRGGHWEGEGRECRSASRAWFYPTSADNTTGFRIARNAD